MADDSRGLLSHFDALLGTEWLDDDPNHAHVRVPMRDDLRQPVGLLHGGVISSLVESVCSRATALAVMGEGMMAMGQSISVNFIRPVTEGGEHHLDNGLLLRSDIHTLFDRGYRGVDLSIACWSARGCERTLATAISSTR